MKVVIDTQAFFSSFVSEIGPARQLVDLWRAGGVTLCVSPGIMEEYFAVMARLGIGGLPEMEEWLEIFRCQSHMLHVTPREHFNAVVHEPADDKFVDCAVAAEAVAVVAGGRHLLLLRRFRGILMLSPADFMYRYRNGSFTRHGGKPEERETGPPGVVVAGEPISGENPAAPTPAASGANVRDSLAARLAGWRKMRDASEEKGGRGR